MAPDSLVDLCTGLSDVVAFELAHLSNMLLGRHGLEVVHEAGVDVRVQVDVLGLV